MPNPLLLGQFSNQHALMVALFTDSTAFSTQRFNPHLASMSWYFGRAVFIELIWFRGEILKQTDLASRVSGLFTQKMELNAEIEAQFPPADHLLNWALEIFEEDLTTLANSKLLPQHPFLEDDDFLALILQYQARYYEKMLEVAFYYACQKQYSIQVKTPLVPALPTSDNFEVSAGYYAIGAKQHPAFAEELPPQIIDLSRYRLKTNLITNAEYLAFLVDEGYQTPDFWTAEGLQWLKQHSPHPLGWTKDNQGRWFGIGIKGAFELIATEPVNGICKHEALAYIEWAKTKNPQFEGAVLPHEYQWEVAIKTQALKSSGRLYEWCSNDFMAYEKYTAPQLDEMENQNIDSQINVLRGTSMHTQPNLRRASLRTIATADYQHPFAGFRVVFPPGEAFWDKSA